MSGEFYQNIDFLLSKINWSFFLSDNWFIQIGVLYILYLVYTTNNNYYTLFYFLIFFFYVGFFLCFYQLDFFVGFLWLTECLLVFVFVLLLFYIANNGNFNKFKKDILKFIIGGGVFGVLVLGICFLLYSESEGKLPIEFLIIDLWDDFYEALNNDVMNDAVGLMISFYLVNSLEFMLLATILLIGSLIVVNINLIFKKIKYPLYNTFLEVFGFLKLWVSGFFLRKQNLTDQQFTKANTRPFSKK